MKPVFFLQIPGQNTNFTDDINNRLRKQGDKVLDVVEKITSDLDGILKDNGDSKKVDYFVPGSSTEDGGVLFRFNGPPVFVLKRTPPASAWKRSGALGNGSPNPSSYHT